RSVGEQTAHEPVAAGLGPLRDDHPSHEQGVFLGWKRRDHLIDLLLLRRRHLISPSSGEPEKEAGSMRPALGRLRLYGVYSQPTRIFRQQQGPRKGSPPA